MKITIILICILIAYLLYYLQNNDLFVYFHGVLSTLAMELLLFFLIVQYRTSRRINSSNLSVQFKAIVKSINENTNFQAYLPQDSDRMSDESVSMCDYEPSLNQSFMKEEEEDGSKDQKSNISQKADLYLTQLKNYFGSQKLPLGKFNRKLFLQKINQLFQLSECLSNYYMNLDKAIDPLNQIQQISRYILKKDITQAKVLLDNLDGNQKYVIMTFNDVQAQLLQSTFQIQNKPLLMPSWGNIKIQIKQLSNIYQSQRHFLSKAAEPQIASFQKAYIDAHKVIKKTKTSILSKYNDFYRKHQQYQGQLHILEKDIEIQNNLYKDLKKDKATPEKLIKSEMNIRLLNQQLQTIQHKLSDSRYNLKELQPEIKKTQQSLTEFKDYWDRQFTVLEQTIVRSLLQTHYENYQQYLKSFKQILKISTTQSPQTQSGIGTPMLKKQKTLMEETDPIRLMRNEREDLQELIQKFQKIEDQIHQLEKYDLDCLQLILEVNEIVKRCCSEDLKFQFQSKIENDWILGSFVQGFPMNQAIYQNGLMSLRNIANNFTDSRLKFIKEQKDLQQTTKERMNHITYLFNCILKDSEQFNSNKSNQGFSDYQKQKQNFQQSYLSYQNESEQVKQRLQSQDKKYQQLIEIHSNYIGSIKFQLIMVFMQISKDAVDHTLKMMDAFDDQYQKNDQIVQSLIQRQSSLSIEGVAFKLDKEIFETTQVKSSSRSGSLNKKLLFTETMDKTQSFTSLKETFVLKQLIKILFLQWTQSLCFRQKFMTELYRSLNKKRPSQLSEIYVTNIDIGGEPPEVLQFLPQKLESSEQACVFDLELSFRGYFYLELETMIDIKLVNKKLPLNIKIKVTSLNGRLRLYYTPSYIGKSWFAFVGEPTMNLNIEPTISNYNLSDKFSLTNDIIREFVIHKIKMLTYPNKERISVPLADYDVEIPQFALDRIQEFVGKLKMSKK